MDFIVVILNVTYVTSGRVISVLADNISESMDVVFKALSFPSVQWGYANSHFALNADVPWLERVILFAVLYSF